MIEEGEMEHNVKLFENKLKKLKRGVDREENNKQVDWIGTNGEERIDLWYTRMRR